MDTSSGDASVFVDALQDVLEGEPGEEAAGGGAPEPSAQGISCRGDMPAVSPEALSVEFSLS